MQEIVTECYSCHRQFALKEGAVRTVSITSDESGDPGDEQEQRQSGERESTESTEPAVAQTYSPCTYTSSDRKKSFSDLKFAESWPTVDLLYEQLDYLMSHDSAGCGESCSECKRIAAVKEVLLRPYRTVTKFRKKKESAA